MKKDKKQNDKHNRITTNQKKELEINIKKIETQIATLPQGKLYVRKNGKYYNYYQVDQNGKRSYIPRKEIESIRNLAQRKYAEKVQKELKNEYAIIKKTLKTCIAQNVRMVYQTMPEGNKNTN